MPRKRQTPTSIPGFGFIFRPTYRDKKTGELKHSAVWHMEYQTKDKPVRRSTGQREQEAAYNELMKLAGMKATGQITTSAPERVTIADLLTLLEESYADHNTLADLKYRTKRMRKYWGETKAIDLDKRALKGWVDSLKRTKRSAATINRYLANLHRAFKLGMEEELVLRTPVFPYQDERSNVRQGVVDENLYRLLRDALAPHAALVLVIGYHVGMRVGEILSLKWDQVDFEAGLIRLGQVDTATKKHRRNAPIWGEMRAYLEMAKAARDKDYPKCPYVVQWRGKRIAYEIKTAWSRALERIGVSGVLIHDLRRTAITRMEEAGIERSAAMEISGHKTEATYKRYRIGSEKRSKAVGEKLEAHTATKKSEEKPVVRQ